MRLTLATVAFVGFSIGLAFAYGAVIDHAQPLVCQIIHC